MATSADTGRRKAFIAIRSVEHARVSTVTTAAPPGCRTSGLRSGPGHAERRRRGGQRLVLLLADQRAAEAEKPAFLGRVGHPGRDLLQPLLEAGRIGRSLLLDQ